MATSRPDRNDTPMYSRVSEFQEHDEVSVEYSNAANPALFGDLPVLLNLDRRDSNLPLERRIGPHLSIINVADTAAKCQEDFRL